MNDGQKTVRPIAASLVPVQQVFRMAKSATRQKCILAASKRGYALKPAGDGETADLTVEQRAGSDYVTLEGIPRRERFEERNYVEEVVSQSPGMRKILALVESLGLKHDRQGEYGLRLRQRDYRRLLKALEEGGR